MTESERLRIDGAIKYEKHIVESREEYAKYNAVTQEFYADIEYHKSIILWLEKLCELTEKAEPKKPRWYGHHFCPSCNSIVYVNCGKDIYCPKCGQRLDWE